MKFKIGRGDAISFWHDSWLHDVPLKTKYPRMFVLAINKNGKIEEFGSRGTTGWAWDVRMRRNLADWELDLWMGLMSDLSCVTLDFQENDRLVWVGNGEGVYTTKSCRKLLSNSESKGSSWKSCVWKGIAPPRVEFFMWQLTHERIAVKVELIKRGVLADSENLCPICKLVPETVKHLFISCNAIWNLWNLFFRAWNLSVVLPNDLKSLLFSWDDFVPNSKIWRFIPGAIIWSVWKVRNSIVFEDETFDYLQLSFLTRTRIATWFLAKESQLTLSKDSLTGDPSLADSLSNHRKKKPIINGWTPPPIGFYKMNVVNEDIVVHDSEGRKIESQLVPIVDAYVDLRNYYARAYLGSNPNAVPNFWLAFTVSVPALGFSTYTVSTSKKPGAGSTRSSIYKFQMGEKPAIEVGEGDLKLTISAPPGKMINYVNKRNLVEESVDQSFSFYTGYNGSNDKAPQNSGAYIFRPNGTYPIKSEQASMTVIKGPLIHEVHQQINTWIFQTTRLYKEKEHVEVEFIVGPVPIEDGFGKEVATQIRTSLESNKTFYTDSNGRDFIKRIRDFRTDWDLEVNQPVAGNYYPITLGIYIQDKEKEFSVLVDRSLAGSSIVDGQIELMLHRRLLLDDSRGVEEALNETVCVLDDCRGLAVQGKYYYRIDSLGEGAKWRRSFGQEIYSPLLLAFAEEDGDKWMSSHTPAFSGIDASYSLPDNVALITLQELEDGKVLLRLAHLYEIGEDSVLSVMTRVELKKLFPGKKIAKVTEMSLSANQEREEMEKRRLVWEVEGEENQNPKVVRGSQVDPKKLEVELAPMEIRTFLIQFEVDLMTAAFKSTVDA
ncbi:hypothetical protein HRI_004614100 [Hibiscus trionum]|uniref:Alpha-mannosidase n=1 Tax=Hibiscus trionum TaxID=183268 RepID=A0A9W7JAT6_HIBTR|nr:hypothetical protein HRI_004614100 [Hibiscus trionum]